MPGIAFENLQTNLRYLFSGVSLANWFSTIFCIFICSFPDIHLFLIGYNLFRFRQCLLTFSTHFCSFTNCFCSCLLVNQSFLLFSTRLPFIIRLHSLMSRFYSFLLICLIKALPVLLNLVYYKTGFHQLESSLASHSITAVQINKRRKR